MFDLFKYKLRKIKSNAWKSKGKAIVYNLQTEIKGDYQDFLTSDYIKELTTRVDKGKKVLDLGCGTGVLSLALANFGYKVSSLDISEEMLNQLKQKINDLSVEIQQGDVFKLPYPNENFDGIITRWVIPHFSEWPLIIQEAARVLKKDGIFVFDMSSKENYLIAEKNSNIDFSRFGCNPYNEKAKNYYASATADEIKLTAKISTLKIIAIIPNGFYRTNALFSSSLNVEEYILFMEKFKEYYKNESVASFIQWFDLLITKKLPTSLVNTLTIVAQKL